MDFGPGTLNRASDAGTKIISLPGTHQLQLVEIGAK
jgi:hypothetical protein